MDDWLSPKATKSLAFCPLKKKSSQYEVLRQEMDREGGKRRKGTLCLKERLPLQEM